MDFCRHLASWHVLLWLAPAATSILLNVLGARVGRLASAFLALGGIGFSLLQGLGAAVYLLWGTAADNIFPVQFSFLTGHVFELSFALNRTGLWALMVMNLVGLAAQVHVLSWASPVAGRHRFHALVAVLVASGGILFTAQTPPLAPVAWLVGWEGLALTGAMLAGFWTPEQSGGRTGMRWLIFQRTSGALLILAFLIYRAFPEWATVLILCAACIRAGQVPFHGWFPDTTRALASASALVHGVASALAAVYLLDRALLDQTTNLIVKTAAIIPVKEVLGVVGGVGVFLGIFAGLYQRAPAPALGWLFLSQGAFAFLAFAAGDPVSARLIIAGQALTLSGITLAVGSAIGPIAEYEAMAGWPAIWRTRRAYLVLVAATTFPLSLTFLGLGRLFVACLVLDRPLGWMLQAINAGGIFGGGWILQRMYRTLSDDHGLAGASNPSRNVWLDLAPGGLAVVSFVLGCATICWCGIDSVGGNVGLVWAGMMCALGWLGWLMSRTIGRKRVLSFSQRLTNTQRMMERIAESGLGVGELVVQLPLIVARGIGVVLWRGVGDFLIDGVLIGGAVRTVDGVGAVLQFFQNGQIRRYSLAIVLATLLLLYFMLRW
jgi:NADH:ubiquinone oxidoreductase subunit 5 (subunit L)/multisubunit Na+/H+ antiporter MnhA subunit